jgi:hypothetical protein
MPKGGARPNAGRKKAPHTIQAEQLRAFLVAEVLKEKGPIVKALIEKAKAGDTQAIREVLERAIGKVKEQVELNGQLNHTLDVSEEVYAAIVKREASRIKISSD